MKISINETEIIKNKDFGSVSVQGSQDYRTGTASIDLTIHNLSTDIEAFDILDSAFRSCQRVNVKFLSEGDYGFIRDLNMVVRSEDIVLDRFSDTPTASFNLETTTA